MRRGFLIAILLWPAVLSAGSSAPPFYLRKLGGWEVDSASVKWAWTNTTFRRLQITGNDSSGIQIYNADSSKSLLVSPDGIYQTGGTQPYWFGFFDSSTATLGNIRASATGDTLFFYDSSGTPNILFPHPAGGGGEANLIASKAAVPDSLAAGKVSSTLFVKGLEADAGIVLTPNDSTIKIGATGGGGGAAARYAEELVDDTAAVDKVARWNAATLQLFDSTAGAQTVTIASDGTDHLNVSANSYGDTTTGTADFPVEQRWKLGGSYFNFDNSASPVNDNVVWAFDSVSGEWTIQAQTGGGGENTSAVNVGTGYAVYYQETGDQLEFKRLNAGPNVEIDSTTTAQTVTIGASGDADSLAGVPGADYATDAEVAGLYVPLAGGTMQAAAVVDGGDSTDWGKGYFDRLWLSHLQIGDRDRGALFGTDTAWVTIADTADDQDSAVGLNVGMVYTGTSTNQLYGIYDQSRFEAPSGETQAQAWSIRGIARKAGAGAVSQLTGGDFTATSEALGGNPASTGASWYGVVGRAEVKDSTTISHELVGVKGLTLFSNNYGTAAVAAGIVGMQPYSGRATNKFAALLQSSGLTQDTIVLGFEDSAGAFATLAYNAPDTEFEFSTHVTVAGGIVAESLNVGEGFIKQLDGNNLTIVDGVLNATGGGGGTAARYSEELVDDTSAVDKVARWNAATLQLFDSTAGAQTVTIASDGTDHLNVSANSYGDTTTGTADFPVEQRWKLGGSYFNFDNSTAPVNDNVVWAFDSVSGEWTIQAQTGGSGENTSAVNVGTGYAVFYQEVVDELQFKRLNAGPNVEIDSTTTAQTVTIGASGDADSLAGVVGADYATDAEVAAGYGTLTGELSWSGNHTWGAGTINFAGITGMTLRSGEIVLQDMASGSVDSARILDGTIREADLWDSSATPAAGYVLRRMLGTGLGFGWWPTTGTQAGASIMLNQAPTFTLRTSTTQTGAGDLARDGTNHRITMGTGSQTRLFYSKTENDGVYINATGDGLYSGTHTPGSDGGANLGTAALSYGDLYAQGTVDFTGGAGSVTFRTKEIATSEIDHPAQWIAATGGMIPGELAGDSTYRLLDFHIGGMAYSCTTWAVQDSNSSGTQLNQVELVNVIFCPPPAWATKADSIRILYQMSSSSAAEVSFDKWAIDTSSNYYDLTIENGVDSATVADSGKTAIQTLYSGISGLTGLSGKEAVRLRLHHTLDPGKWIRFRIWIRFDD